MKTKSNRRKEQVKIKSVSTILFYILVFLPYLNIINLNTDTQINAFVISSIIICCWLVNRKKIFINRELKILFFISFISIFIAFLIQPVTFTSFRRVFSYISLSVVCLTTYNILIKENGINEKLVKIIMLIWFIVGIIQTLIKPDFATWIISRASTSSTRGAVGLAPEPTYYATMCVFFIIIALRFKSKRTFYIAINLIQILFLSKSSMIVVVLFAGIIIYICAKLYKPYSIVLVLVSGLVLTSGYYTINEFMEGSRLFHIVNRLDNPMELLVEDESINQRVGHIFYSVKGFIENLGLPHGYSAWYKYLEVQDYSEYFPWVRSTDLIMSGYGAALFEIGVFGFCIIQISYKSVKYYLTNKLNSMLLFIFITMIMLTAFPLSNPIYQFIIGYGLYLRNEKLMKET